MPHATLGLDDVLFVDTGAAEATPDWIPAVLAFATETAEPAAAGGFSNAAAAAASAMVLLLLHREASVVVVVLLQPMSC